MQSPVYILRVLAVDTDKEVELQVGKDHISVSIAESIHSLYPVVNMVLRDPSGMIKEFGYLVYGRKLIIEYGIPTEKAVNRMEYVVIDQKISFIQGANGDITFTLIPSMFAKQRLHTKAFKNKKVSDCVKEIMSQYKEISYDYFQETDLINTTWYQTNTTDMKFLQKVLLKNAYAESALFTPFYAFLTTNGKFNFASYQYMKKFAASSDVEKDRIRVFQQIFAKSETSGAPKIEAVEKAQASKKFIPENFTILSLEKLATSGYDIFKWLHSQTRIIDYGQNDLSPKLGEDIETSLALYGAHETNKIKGIIYDVEDDKNLTGQNIKIRMSHSIEEDIYLKAQIIQEKSDQFFLERYAVRLVLNPLIHAGDMLILAVQAMELDSGVSKANTGMFIVEMAEHIWSKEEGVPPQTKLIIGRHTPDLLNVAAAQEILEKDTAAQKWYSGTFTYNSPTNKYFKVKGTKYA